MEYYITKVSFDCLGDSVKALYVNERLKLSGDEYNNDITNSIEAFIDGLQFAKDEGWCATLKIEEYNTEDFVDIHDVPLTFEDVRTQYIRYEGE